MKTAQNSEEIKPLIDLCKAGKLFEVEEWIASGKPVNLPLVRDKKGPRQSPLQIAMELGFHSLVKVLIEGGADLNEPRYPPLEHAIWKRRLDLVELLIKAGLNVRSMDLANVFESWNPEIVKYFIEQGADLENGNPVAWALCSKIRPALGLLKTYQDRFPGLQAQADIALRRHCWDGNQKWVALMLWAGADPYTRGPDSPGEDSDPDEHLSALEIAAFHGHLEIFKMKAIRLDPKHPDAPRLLKYATYAESAEVLSHLLGKGFDPQLCEGKGSSLIYSILSGMSYDWDWNPFSGGKRKDKDLDTQRTREKIKMVHLLARNGARWEPKNQLEINHVRRSLLKMTPDYTTEFVWIMSKYKACSKETIEGLFRTAPIRLLVQKHQARLNQLIAAFLQNTGSEPLQKPFMRKSPK